MTSPATTVTGTLAYWVARSRVVASTSARWSPPTASPARSTLSGAESPEAAVDAIQPTMGAIATMTAHSTNAARRERRTEGTHRVFQVAPLLQHAVAQVIAGGAPIVERSEQEPIEAQRRAAAQLRAAGAADVGIVERSEQEPIEAQRRAATQARMGGAVRRRADKAPIVERSEQEPIEAQRRAATKRSETSGDEDHEASAAPCPRPDRSPAIAGIDRDGVTSLAGGPRGRARGTVRFRARRRGTIEPHVQRHRCERPADCAAPSASRLRAAPRRTT